MHFTYLSAHAVLGLVHKADSPDIELIHDRSHGLRVTITSRPNEHLRLVNRHMALLSMMLRALIREPLPADFNANLAEYISKVEAERLASVGTDATIIVKVRGHVDALQPTATRQVEDYVLCFDAVDRKALRTRVQSTISAVLTALRLGAAGQYEFRSVAEGVYLTNEDGLTVHSVTAEAGTLGVYVSRAFTDAQQIAFASDVPLILRATSLERVARLHTQSLNKSTDNYRSFVAAWSALEILVGKLFPVYQKLLVANLRGVRHSAGLHAYLDRVASIMEGKHSLADKFAVISIYLDGQDNPDELKAFRSLKEVRDGLSHGDEVPESELPTREVQMLFDKYFRAHLRRDSNPLRAEDPKQWRHP